MKKTLNWGILGTSFISGVMADAIIAEGCIPSRVVPKHR